MRRHAVALTALLISTLLVLERPPGSAAKLRCTTGTRRLKAARLAGYARAARCRSVLNRSGACRTSSSPMSSSSSRSAAAPMGCAIASWICCIWSVCSLISSSTCAVSGPRQWRRQARSNSRTHRVLIPRNTALAEPELEAKAVTHCQ